ncbi:hypothetical protein F6464_12985 [Flavobacterium luteum]|uniref:Uncharacterized protein n=1 Tax=Flavobacterium luteum TaxID=2026654 RepID=A0A7J5A9X9_9FLAO|nr:hypothetical protein F6464_12985 [Flavobacterium luteum]
MSDLVLSKAGNQVPVILLLDDGGNVKRVSPEQIGEGATNVGVIFGFTVMVSGAVVAHCPAVGVKV